MIMKRSVKAIVRYYRIDISENLFGEWIVIRTFGSQRRSKPTGEIMKSFEGRAEAQRAMEKLVRLKIKKGYVALNVG